MCCTITAAACDVLVPYSYPKEESRKGQGGPTRDVVERRKATATARPRNRRDIEARRQAKIAAREKSSAAREGCKYNQNKVEPCCLELFSFFLVAPCPQHPAKRAQFRVTLLNGGARARELGRRDRPSGGRGTRPAVRAREK